MSVAINTERKGVEISWDPAGQATEPPVEEKPPGYPAHPIILPGEPTHPIVLPDPPDPEEPPAGGGEAPGYNPPVGLPDPPNYPYPVSDAGGPQAVQVFGQGQDGDWSNTAIMPNDGLAFLSYPKGFTGESYIEVRSALDGSLVDSGTITVE